MGAPAGNQNAAKGRLWDSAIRRALARRNGGDYRQGLNQLAEKLLDACEAGDVLALKTLGERLDGKGE